MGEVYRATDLTLGQSVALKFLPEEAARNQRLLERFHGEVRVARQVSHPNVCRVYDIGEAEGMPFISMEYVDGEDFASLLPRIGRLPADKALEAARKYPLIVIDGCRPRCASAIAKGKGLAPAATVWVAEVAAQAKLSLAGENRKGLGEKGMALARRLADETIEKIDLIVAEETMSTL
jgi:hypothetical protein